jgi:hypothetical protein
MIAQRLLGRPISLGETPTRRRAFDSAALDKSATQIVHCRATQAIASRAMAFTVVAIRRARGPKRLGPIGYPAGILVAASGARW